MTIDAPAGTQVAPDGTVTLPSNGEVTAADGTVIHAPGGTRITPNGTTVIPGGTDASLNSTGGVTLYPTGGATVAPTGMVTFPQGSGGGKVTLTNGQTLTLREDVLFTFDDEVPLGYYVSIVNPFEDVSESDWFYDEVMFAYAHNIMFGMSTEPMLFAPNDTVTRGMVATLLCYLAGAPDVSGITNTFEDVVPEDWYYNALLWAAANGIVDAGGAFGPKDFCALQDMVVMFNNYANRTGLELVPVREYTAFADDADISENARAAVEATYRAGIVNGKQGSFGPLGFTTRAELATMVKMLIELAQ
jgi:hypothetical protein